MMVKVVCLSLLLTACSSEIHEAGTVSGNAKHRDDTGFPNDSVLKVQIMESMGRATPGEQNIQTEGRQVIPFAVTYDPSQIEATWRYGVYATIEDTSGKVLFLSEGIVQVINGGPTEGINLTLMPTGGDRWRYLDWNPLDTPIRIAFIGPFPTDTPGHIPIDQLKW